MDRNLGMRCVDVMREAKAQGAGSAPYGQPNTSEFVRMVLAPCVRDIDGDGDLERLGLTVGNWCAAAACWALEQAIQEGEERPHLYRAGVVEMVADAEKLGRWFPLETVEYGYRPQAGDLAVWDRSDPSKPSTAWWRHVNRITKCDESGFKTIGGNERRGIRVAHHSVVPAPPAKLLGFISYVQGPAVEKNVPLMAEDHSQLLALIDEFHAKMREAVTEQLTRDALAT